MKGFHDFFRDVIQTGENGTVIHQLAATWAIPAKSKLNLSEIFLLL